MIVVVDTETTGLEPGAQVVELAAVWLDENTLRTTYAHSTLVRPTVPVQPDARAAHHITDEELAAAPQAAQLPLHAMLPPHAHMAAHNVEFDAAMLRGTWPTTPLPARHICTFKCSRHAWPQAPRHSNQVLRYWLDLPVPRAAGLPAHRALADAHVTTAVLQQLLQLYDVDQLVEMTRRPALLHTVTFGQHRGKLWSAVDKGFLRWILGKDFDEDTKYTARYYLGMEK